MSVYNLDTVYWSGVRDKVKQEIATRERSKYAPKARELITHYQNVIKGLEEDAKKYPKAAAGLRNSILMYQKRIQDLQKYLSGGEAPDWFARLVVHDVSSSDLAKLPESAKKEINLKTGFYVPVKRVTENTGVKTVPKPQLKPSVIETKIKPLPAPNPTVPHSVTSTSTGKTDYKKLGLYVVGAILAYMILKRFVR